MLIRIENGGVEAQILLEVGGRIVSYNRVGRTNHSPRHSAYLLYYTRQFVLLPLRGSEPQHLHFQYVST